MTRTSILQADQVLSALPPISIIGAGWGLGAPDRGCADAPDALQAGSLTKRLQARAAQVEWLKTLRAPEPVGDVAEAIETLCAQLAQLVAQALQAGRLPIVLGGDHSCAIGTWRGVAQARAAQGVIGLLWFDAHLDSHLPHTSPSGALHGMPLAVLLGHGDARLTQQRAHIHAEHLCVVGARSFEAEEAALLLRLGVRVFSMAEIRRRGMALVMQEALAIVASAPGGFGVSLDLDVLDPTEAPGVSTPASDGLRIDELTAALQSMRARPLALEVTEYQPRTDPQQRTAALVAQLLLAALP